MTRTMMLLSACFSLSFLTLCTAASAEQIVPSASALRPVGKTDPKGALRYGVNFDPVS